jgi:RNA polymerase sigma factor (sigma-70 family)
MDGQDWLAEQFEANRAHLGAVAYRMLGSHSEAQDAVQEAWLRLSRSEAGEITNLGGWLTTVVSRLCLDMLRSRRSRREESLDTYVPDPIVQREDRIDPEQQALVADSVSLALLVVLEMLDPAERLALVLHDMFAVPFDDIAAILGRSGPATRQLASRARRRVQTENATRDTDRLRQARLVDAFLAAARHGDFEALLAVLDPDVVLRADETAVQLGAAPETGGAAEVAGFSRFARGAKSAFLDGAPAAVWMAADRPRVVYDFTVSDGRIVAIDLIADPDRLSGLDLAIVDQAVGPW